MKIAKKVENGGKGDTPPNETPRWTDDLYASDDMTYTEMPICTFCEFDRSGNDKHCWFKPSAQVCMLCLIGELIGELQYLRMDYEKYLEAKERG